MDREDERLELEESFARALFVCAWADACGELTGGPGDDSIECYCCGAPGVGDGEPHEEDCEAERIAQEKSPGAQEDWMDYAPETSAHARAVAKYAIAAIAKRNKVDLLDVFEANSALDDHRRDPELRDFGHYLAMEWLGHGVGWADDHPDHGLELGGGEYYIHDVRDTEDAWPPIKGTVQDALNALEARKS